MQDNPFDRLNKVPPSYDKTQSTLMTQMKDSDWIYTGQVMIIKIQSYTDEKEDSLGIWTYDKTTGEIGYSNPPYKPNQVVYNLIYKDNKNRMKKLLKEKMNEGFSLVELVMVMVILGILSALST